MSFILLIYLIDFILLLGFSMKKILLIDPLDEKGHKFFNAEFIGAFDKNIFELTLITSSSSSDYYMHKVQKLKTYPDFLLSKKNRLLYGLFQLYILLYSFFIRSKSSYDAVIFLSYELPSMAMFSHFLRGNDYLVEHNTISTGFVKSNLFKCISKSVTHICLEKYIALYIKSYFRKRSTIVSHPYNSEIIQFINKNTFNVVNSNKKVFMPSATIKAEVFNDICNSIADNDGFLLLAKGEDKILSKNIIVKRFYDNYIFEMVTSNFVLIPQCFEYRVSGVFYEAILIPHIIIVMSDCLFANEMKIKFGDRIHICLDWSNIAKDLMSLSSRANLTSKVVNAHENHLHYNHFSDVVGDVID